MTWVFGRRRSSIKARSLARNAHAARFRSRRTLLPAVILCRTFREEHSPRPGCLPGGSPPSTLCEGSRDPARAPPFTHHTLGRGFRLREEPAEKASGAAMAAIGQKGLPVIVWNIRLYAGITLHWL